METEKLIAALRYCDAVVNDTVNTGSCNFCPYRDHCSDLDNEAADALERLTAESAEKDAEIGRLTNLAQDAQKQWKAEYAMRRKFEADRDRLQAELDAAVEDMNHIAREIEKCDWTLAKDGEKVGSLHLGRCAVCNHRYCDEEILDGCHFEWRGKEHG